MAKRRRHGDGSVYQRNSDGKWLASVGLPARDGKRRRKVLVRGTEKEALKALRQAMADLERSGDLATSSPTLSQWLELWLTDCRKRLKPRTAAEYAAIVKNYISPTIGSKRLEKLTTGHVRELHAYMEDRGLSTTTMLHAHRALVKALNDAMREGRVPRNVAALVDAPRQARSPRTALTADEAKILLGSVRGERQLHFALALLTGIRQGERLGITRDAIDLERGTLTISWQLQRLKWEHGCTEPCGKGAGWCPERHVRRPADQEARQVGGLWLTRPKSKAGWRQIPLEGPLLDAVRNHLASVELDDTGLIFRHYDARNDRWSPIDPSADSKAWKDACEAVGITAVPLHAARHTTATLMYELGVPQQTREAILGHSSATVTAGYTHVSNPLKVDAMRQVGGLLALD